jgi:hypothetical protein
MPVFLDEELLAPNTHMQAKLEDCPLSTIHISGYYPCQETVRYISQGRVMPKFNLVM